jgi:hypothetical protein
LLVQIQQGKAEKGEKKTYLREVLIMEDKKNKIVQGSINKLKTNIFKRYLMFLITNGIASFVM